MNIKMAGLKTVITDKNKKNYFVMAREISTLWVRDKEFPKHYFLRLAYKKDSPDYKYFVPEAVLRKLWSAKELNSPEVIEVLKNKIKFENFCIKEGFSTPRILAHNEGASFFINEVELHIESAEFFKAFLEEILEANNVTGIFLKPLAGIQGRGCFKLQAEDLEDKQVLENVLKTMLTSEYIIQGTIKQHRQLNKIHANSVNTIRLDTYIDDTGEAKVLSGLMRFGVKGGIVDNARAGGFFMSVDLQKGVLKNVGLQPLSVGNNIYFEHPDTLIKLVDFPIPFVEEAKDLVKSAAEKLGGRFIGWDVAISEDGPMLVEGNSNYAIGMADTAYGGYMKHELFKEIVQKYA